MRAAGLLFAGFILGVALEANQPRDQAAASGLLLAVVLLAAVTFVLGRRLGRRQGYDLAEVDLGAGQPADDGDPFA